MIGTNVRRPNRAHAGFTLIEVLVVVAIIALLISVLLPSLHKAREQTKAVICKTRLGQLFRAHTFYAADDKKGVFPHWAWWLWDAAGKDEAKTTNGWQKPADVYAKTGGIRSSDSRVWVTYGDIYKYIKDKEVYFCASDSKTRPQSGSIGSGQGGNGSYPIHSFVRLLDPHWYMQQRIDNQPVVNNTTLQAGDFINPDKLKPGVFKGKSRSGSDLGQFFSIPQRVVMMIEEDQGLGDYVKPNSIALNDGHSSVVYWEDYISARHEKRGNVIYFDGHAEFVDSIRWNKYDTAQDDYVIYKALGGGNLAKK